MTRRQRTLPEPVPRSAENTPEVRHRAALVVAAHATGPEDARELLAMLRLIDDPEQLAP